MEDGGRAEGAGSEMNDNRDCFPATRAGSYERERERVRGRGRREGGPSFIDERWRSEAEQSRCRQSDAPSV